MKWSRAPQNSSGSAALVRTDGKQFRLDSRRFHFRGVTYGTFRAREDGSLFPERQQLKLDLIAIAEARFTVVRTYTQPPDDLLEIAADWDLRVMSDIFYLDWRYLIGASRRQVRRIAAEARRAVRTEARRLAGNERVLALSLGNEIPADVVRWVGTRRIAEVIGGLATVVHEEDPDRLVTYANYPTTEYLAPEGLDFLTFNVFLEDEQDFRRYITHLQNLADERPLVLGEIGMDAGSTASGESRQQEAIDSQLSIALERGVAGTCVFSWTDDWWVNDKPVEGWRFGLTRKDRSPRPALEKAEKWNGCTVKDLREEWPSLSVVICAYNAASTLNDCLSHTCALEYPNLEVIVVDDGSTDGTRDIARRHPRARLVPIAHSGLGVARNEGFRSARGDIIAYLDADAFPSPEWPYFIALGFDGRLVGGVGGPNMPPYDDPLQAQMVARSPGGPVHVLFSDDRAEHIPGCNMAFWRSVLTEVGGFDPVFTAAGDDIDLCWKVLDHGWEISFSPAALVWHRRRGGLRAYLRQQLGYGKAEALVEARHPDRFGPLHTANWRGRIYNALVPRSNRQRIYRGPFGLSPYQSVYQGGSHALDTWHQAGVLVALAALALSPLAFVHPALGSPAIVSAIVLGSLAVIDMKQVKPPRAAGFGFRASVALHHLLQPLVRFWGRWTSGQLACRNLPCRPIPGPVRKAGRNVLVFPSTGTRGEIVGAAVSGLRRAGFRVRVASEWADHDAQIASSRLVHGALLTTAHLPQVVQLRIRPCLLVNRVIFVGLVALGSWVGNATLGQLIIALAGADMAWGCWRSGPWALKVLEREIR